VIAGHDDDVVVGRSAVAQLSKKGVELVVSVLLVCIGEVAADDNGRMCRSPWKFAVAVR